MSESKPRIRTHRPLTRGLQLRLGDPRAQLPLGRSCRPEHVSIKDRWEREERSDLSIDVDVEDGRKKSKLEDVNTDPPNLHPRHPRTIRSTRTKVVQTK